jgi:LytS/YehU family sensor histidine kinase
MWALFTAMIVTMHGGPLTGAALLGLRMMIAAALIVVVAQRLIDRVPWPHPFRVSFAAVHIVGAVAYAAAWILLNSLIDSVMHGGPVIVLGPGIVPFLIMGVWLYVMVAGVSYATLATQRAARAESSAARAQLAALRSQLNPHFLFNALHTVVQLIPREPRRAAQAAEQLGGLLRETIEEDRDLVTVGDERAFVERYLDVERLRFGDRLRVRVEIPREADNALVPPFALLTLVENAVRHGAEPNIEPTEVVVSGSMTNGLLSLTVIDDGAGATLDQMAKTKGTGLRRLHERLIAFFGSAARLEVVPNSGRGVTATLVIPRQVV